MQTTQTRSRRPLVHLCLALGMLFSSVSTSSAEDKKPAETISLFDGKTLTGWELLDPSSSGAVVKEGVLVLEQGEPISTIVWKGEKLPTVDYEFSMQARRVEGSDFFATLTFPVKDEYCSLVLGGWGGGLIGLSSVNGADASENETTDYFEFEKNKWYTIRVRVTQTAIQAWIDDKQICNLDISEKSLSVRIEMERSKPLGLSSYRTTGELRNLKIEKLTATKKGQADQ
ncbi:3-keto-disaccharide hydrolase [Planctomicrobium sp. SH661]|uniref:3-keto-disaccharide hydrolase n=1 Tax=Planctomicrobium sp. SH661 TaxID=3448124 RepID=UPI003F5B09FD